MSDDPRLSRAGRRRHVLGGDRRLCHLLAQVARVLRAGGLFLFDAIYRNLLSRLATITMAEDVLRLLSRGTHDPATFIKPRELPRALKGAGRISQP